ncbi:MAG: ABC transporter ATP-binding protein [Alicyclobacillus sp.]|nr:ABC transporter ATP-binding protein [Alicyclobacillus sp.]
MTIKPIVQIKDLSIDFVTRYGTTHAVNHVFFDIPEGKVTALVGESGSGKTTLATSILKMTTGVITSGEILFNGKDVLKLGKEALRQFRWTDVSMVFQAAQSALNPVMRIQDQFIQTVKEHRNVSTPDILKKTRQLLEYVRLDPDLVLRSYPHELSGGMKQRVMIAFSLILDPKLVILDEPTTALDVITQDYIFDILGQINRDFGTTMLLVTHDIGIVARVADYIGVMYAGKLVEFGDIFDTFDNPKHPYTKGLIQATPSLISNNDEIVQIGGSPPDLQKLPSGCAFHPRCPVALDICKTNAPVARHYDDGGMVACHLKNEDGRALTKNDVV